MFFIFFTFTLSDASHYNADNLCLLWGDFQRVHSHLAASIIIIDLLPGEKKSPKHTDINFWIIFLEIKKKFVVDRDGPCDKL